MKIIHIGWQLVGKVMVADDDDNVLVLGKDADGNDAREGIIAINVERFSEAAFVAAAGKAIGACEELLAKLSEAQPLTLVPGDELMENENEALQSA